MPRRELADQALKDGDTRLVSLEKVGRCDVLIERACLILLDPDPELDCGTHRGASPAPSGSLDYAVSTDRLCRLGAPMKNLAHSASFDSEDEDAPSKPGIKHLGGQFGSDALSMISAIIGRIHPPLFNRH